MRRVLTLVFAIVQVLAVVLALFVAPLRASPTVSNAPLDWEIISGGFSEDGTQLCQHPFGCWNQPLPDGCAIQTKTLNKKALRTGLLTGRILTTVDYQSLSIFNEDLSFMLRRTFFGLTI